MLDRHERICASLSFRFSKEGSRYPSALEGRQEAAQDVSGPLEEMGALFAFGRSDPNGESSTLSPRTVAEVQAAMDACLSCGEGMPEGECPKSLRMCGHHCNCSWTQDVCDWCGAEFGDVDDPSFGIPASGLSSRVSLRDLFSDAPGHISLTRD